MFTVRLLFSEKQNVTALVQFVMQVVDESTINEINDTATYFRRTDQT